MPDVIVASTKKVSAIPAAYSSMAPGPGAGDGRGPGVGPGRRTVGVVMTDVSLVHVGVVPGE